VDIASTANPSEARTSCYVISKTFSNEIAILNSSVVTKTFAF